MLKSERTVLKPDDRLPLYKSSQLSHRKTQGEFSMKSWVKEFNLNSNNLSIGPPVIVMFFHWGLSHHHCMLLAAVHYCPSLVLGVTVGFEGEGLRLLSGGIAGRTCMFRRGSPTTAGGREQRDWLWGGPDLCCLEACGGGKLTKPRPREPRGRDLDFFTPWDTWSGGRETEKTEYVLTSLLQSCLIKERFWTGLHQRLMCVC